MPATLSRIEDSIQELGDGVWVIANRILLSRQSVPPSDCRPSWSDGDGSFFVLSHVTGLLKPRPLSDTSGLPLVYSAGGVSAVWRAGEAFIKVKEMAIPSATREHVTLDYLHNKAPLGFDIPRVYHHAEFDGRYCVILSRLPGPTLAEAWTGLNETTREYYVDRVATICRQLATWKGSCISGVDGQQLPDLFLTKLGAVKNCDPQALLTNCKQWGIDCSSICFYHCDLGPHNIIVNPKTRSIGIVDWEVAGFVPRPWIRTKFCLSSGMDLPVEDEDARVDWRRRVSRRLGDMGFPEVADEWHAWWSGM